ncbi:MAG TPA: hypothetical protein VEH52_00615 [Gaiellaceae bacterium]|nr:hypothetical protein [Gaiellaceae bacterium]
MNDGKNAADAIPATPATAATHRHHAGAAECTPIAKPTRAQPSKKKPAPKMRTSPVCVNVYATGAGIGLAPPSARDPGTTSSTPQPTASAAADAIPAIQESSIASRRRGSSPASSRIAETMNRSATTLNRPR